MESSKKKKGGRGGCWQEVRGGKGTGNKVGRAMEKDKVER